MSNQLVQIVDADGGFIDKNEIDKIVDGWGFKERGFQWFVVAILGCQSSGKSTLLNLLFGTSFQVMEQTKGRTQTTQGVWMALSQNQQGSKDNVLVLDVEGVDSRERGEQHAAFERKTSLFSLALSEILLINLWHHDVGRYNAGNVALLKDVFELNLQLFQRSPTGARSTKTLLLFVIRDHEPMTPLSTLQKTIEEDMNKIWRELKKPSQFENSSVTNFFDFKFVGLPHKIYSPKDFEAGVVRLRERFVKSDDSEYILDANYRKDIPSDGFTMFAGNIWQTIKENKDLDLPTQREMLAIYRCDDIIEKLVESLTKSTSEAKDQLDNGQIIADFGSTMTTKIEDLLTEYDTQARWYDSNIVASKRKSLVTKLEAVMVPLYTAQLKLVAEGSLAKFEEAATIEYGNKTAHSDFAARAESICNMSLDYFKTEAQASVIKSFADWTFEKELRDLQKSLDKSLTSFREAEMTKMKEEAKAYLRGQLEKTLQKVEQVEPNNIWPNLRQSFEQETSIGKDTFVGKLKGFQLASSVASEEIDHYNNLAEETLKKLMQEKNKFLQFVMTKRFERFFNKDEDGLPRRWKPEDNIKDYFKKAKEQGDLLLEKFVLFRLDPKHDSIVYLDLDSKAVVDSNLVLMSRDEAQHIKDSYEKSCEASYVQARRDQETIATSAHVPVYMLILLAVLGFNEFIYIITSPLLLLLVILLGIGGFVVYSMGMSGPAIQIGMSLMRTLVAQVNLLIQQAMQQAAAGQQAPPAQAGNKRKAD